MKRASAYFSILAILGAVLSAPLSAYGQDNEIYAGSCFKLLTYEANLHQCPGENVAPNFCGGTQSRRRSDFNAWWGYELQESPVYGWAGSGGYYDRRVESGLEPASHSHFSNWATDSCAPGSYCSAWFGSDWRTAWRNACYNPSYPVEFPVCDADFGGDHGGDSRVRHGGYPLPYAPDGASLHLACYDAGMPGCSSISGTSYECEDPNTGAPGLIINWGHYNCGSNYEDAVRVDCNAGPGVYTCANHSEKERGWWYNIQGRCSCSRGCPQGWQCCPGNNECRPSCDDNTLSCSQHSDCAYMNGVCACGSCAPIPPVSCAQESDCSPGNICSGGACTPECGEGVCSNDSQCGTDSCCRSGQCITGTMCSLATPTPTPTTTPTPTPTPQVTVTVIPTNTPPPAPTDTPFPFASPTPTPTPTVPAPTLTPTPQPTSDGDGIFLRE